MTWTYVAEEKPELYGYHGGSPGHPAHLEDVVIAEPGCPVCSYVGWPLKEHEKLIESTIWSQLKDYWDNDF